jgi:hypothetical protein
MAGVRHTFDIRRICAPHTCAEEGGTDVHAAAELVTHRDQLVAGFPGREFSYKPYQGRDSVDASEPAAIALHWPSKWRKASNRKGYERN